MNSLNETTTAAPAAAVNAGQRPIALWLLACCALVFAMVVLGGVTRLTGSGLSIVEWEPVKGALPPLDQADWQELFAEYQRTPEYQHVNRHMSLDDFKGIFWLEYLHRLLGRLIGVVFLLPFLYFLIRRRITAVLAPKLAAVFILGGLQGALGWYMVKSGLIDDPHVSQYRLTAHLLLAVALYGYMLWTALGLLRSPGAGAALKGGLKAGVYALVGLILLTMAAGGFVAGLKAGKIYNTFPLMGDYFTPPNLFALDPWWLNFFENPATAQLDHRLLAMAILLIVVLLWFAARRSTAAHSRRAGFHWLLAVAVAQVALGIATLLQSVPVALAAAHQAGALVLLTVALALARRAR
ncbi:MAG: COX15/CtaA family protein [Gammaproteobacteria bacterium]